MPVNFRKGAYIVITDDPPHSSFHNTPKAFRQNYIYKQRTTYYHLRPVADCNGNLENGWDRYQFSSNKNWRFATELEIKRYNRRNKPYDVSKLDTFDDLLMLLDELEEFLLSKGDKLC